MAGFRVVLACVAASAIAGCATLPEYRDDPIKTAEVVRNVRCELVDAIRSDLRGNQWLLTEHGKGWLVKLSFDLSVDHSGDISTGDNTWIFPMNQGATFVLTLGAGLTGTGNRRENIEFDHSVRDLNNDPNLYCPDEQRGRHAQLSGYLGIEDLIERASRSREVPTDDGALSKLGYTVEFIVKRTANLTPKFNLIPIGKEKTYTGTPKWIGTRSDTQKLTLTFTLPAAEKEKEECPVRPDGGGEWPEGTKCPAAVYIVDVVRTCPAVIEENRCTGRTDCKWTDGRCTSKDPARAAARGAPRVVRSAPSAPSSGLSPADRQKLDNAQTRGLLQDIESQLSRQRLGN